MNGRELKSAFSKLEKEYRKNCKKLHREYALEHNPVKINDIIYSSFENKTIKVYAIEVPEFLPFCIPHCKYSGYIVSENSASEQIVTSKETVLFQYQITTINNQPYKYKI